MKIVSFGTNTIDESGFDVDYDLTIFFELTDKIYDLMISQTWDDLYDLFGWCDSNSVGCWNVSHFSNDDSLGLSGSIYEHTTQKLISDIYQF